MLTSLKIRNFKRFGVVEIPLGQAVVFIGPNNSGKTTALQALALWHAGLTKWFEKRGQGSDSKKGITINRQDLIAIPVPDANLLWTDLHVRNVERLEGKPQTQNIRIEVIVEGITKEKPWKCGLEFDYANPESLYCRPARTSSQETRMPIPEEAYSTKIAYLPPMSGLAANEPKFESGRINVLLGEGQTAQVLRNLCFQVYGQTENNNWVALQRHLSALFKVELFPPKYVVERGELTMSYRERNGVELDLASSGRGFQQILLLLAHQYAHPGSTILLDEPDAHLEILRQRETYGVVTKIASETGSQVIAASHSEVVLDEAARRDVVVAFLGKPHRIDVKGQLGKSLKDIPLDHYYQAEQTGWILYLEGSTDLSILRVFAEKLGHPALEALARPFVHYVSNQPKLVQQHFYGLAEAKTDLVGLAVFDRLDRALPDDFKVGCRMWKRREIENYIFTQESLIGYASVGIDHSRFNDLPLFESSEVKRREKAMREAIDDVASALKTLNKDPFSADIKATDDFLDPLFDRYFAKLGLPNVMRKTGYYQLAQYISANQLVPEVTEILDAILTAYKSASPAEE